MISRRLLAIGLCLIPAAAKQDPPPEVTTHQGNALFQASSNLVQVPVVVRDSNGRAVGNLHAEDFRLSDNGKPQLIARFSVEQMQSRESSQVQSTGATAAGSSPAALPTRFVAYLADDVTVSPADS